MPSFDIDVTRQAIDYTKASIANMPGNPGQTTLVSDLEYDGYCIVTVNIAGDQVDTEAQGDLRLHSNHPEAIEIIMGAAQDSFAEFVDKLGGQSGESYNGLDIIKTVRQQAVDEAFGEL
jgi:hypothetical protein